MIKSNNLYKLPSYLFSIILILIKKKRKKRLNKYIFPSTSTFKSQRTKNLKHTYLYSNES